jgi:hypothetical protein
MDGPVVKHLTQRVSFIIKYSFKNVKGIVLVKKTIITLLAGYKMI